MVAAVDWSNLTLAGGFIVGAVLATVATLRLLRHVLTMFERDPTLRRRDRSPDDVTPPK